MRTRIIAPVSFLLLTVAAPVQAVTYYDNVYYRSQSTGGYYGSSYTGYTGSARPPQNGSTCLYTNPQGECMIEQYIDPGNRRQTYPVYDQNYLRNERNFSTQYDYRHYNYDYTNNYDYCDYNYDYNCRDGWRAIDNGYFYDSSYDSGFDYERYFGNSHGSHRHDDDHDDDD